MSKTDKKRVHLIACGVLSLDFEKIQSELGIDMSVEYLPGGLHETPKKLKEELQERIDVASKNDVADMLAIGYGICGRGTVGIKARNIPLAIPKVHDCISLFLGSDREYRKQFLECPGTYYVSAGWVNEKVTPQEHCKTCQVTSDNGSDLGALIEKYGQENAEDIEYFLSSWQRNYERAAFIDTGVSHRSEKYIELAKKMASDYGWKYERLEGTHNLLKSLIKTRSTSDEILIVPPKYTTVWDSMGKGLSATAAWDSGTKDVDKTAIYMGKGGEEIEESEFCSMQMKKSPAIKLGMGIDAGGTYTDIVLYDFVDKKVIKKAKAATTKWDFTIGINEAIGRLELENPEKIEMVTLSTTLATNSIVEGKGQKVGLLIMPPFGIFSPSDIDYSPIAVIEGRLDINGKELKQIDHNQVIAIARDMIEKEGVEAFAVTGFASVVNHQHELEVKEILKQEFDCSVTCGYEISADLNYRVRSITSALNARIIPCLEKLLSEMGESLEKQGIVAPKMVVRSDGSLMNVKTALERPIETILSGPAASAKGAGHLANLEDGLVVDIGGTTTDTAIIRDGKVLTNLDGASVGGYRTHIKTLDLRTVGLGGDSNINRRAGEVSIGPERVMPICRASRDNPQIMDCIDWVGRRKDKFVSDSYGMEIVSLTNNDLKDEPHWSDSEKEIIELLRARPMSVQELCENTGAFSPKYLPLARLESVYHIQRIGLTPTDLLHVIGKVDFWDASAAKAVCEIFGEYDGKLAEEFAEDVLLEVRKSLALEMIKREISGEVDVDKFGESPVAELLLNNLFSGGNYNYKVGFELQHSIIGIGAPTRDLLIPANEWLGAECVIPLHAEVANAVGAIISSVHIEKELRIEPGSDGGYVIQGIVGSPSFVDFEKAHEKAINELHKIVLESARASGTNSELVKIGWHDKISDVYDGGALFIARVYTGEVTGMPSV